MLSNILLINHYFSTPATGNGGRTHYLARELVRLGHNVTVVGARRHHLLLKETSDDALPSEEEIDGYRLLRLNVPRYARANDKRRILAWFTFAFRLLVLHKKLGALPDVVLFSSPHPIGYLGAEYLARASGARLVFEVRDIWPLTLIQLGGYGQWHPFIRFLQWIEDRAYSRSDCVVSNLEGALEHMAARGMDKRKFTWIPNGIALDEVLKPAQLSPQVAAQIPVAGLRVVYAGTLGAANALYTLIRSVALIRDLADVTILLVGQGQERAKLEAQCYALGLHNIRFLGAVPKAQVQSLISACDVCYLGWHASPLYCFGIAANKLPEYLYSGKPIVHSYSGENDPIAKFSAGITVPAEDPKGLADAIRRLHIMSNEQRQFMGENGRRAAIEHYDYRVLARRLERVLVD